MTVKSANKKSSKSASGCGKYIFFIGGSGARAYRAFLHACAAGAVREDEVRIMLLDADTSNAACIECEELYRLYSAQYEMFRKMMSKERGKRRVSTPAFHCKVTMYHEKAVSPVETNKRRLELLVPGHHTNGKRALGWFYDETEREQDLFNGFYAHPNIGCLFFQNFSGGSSQNPDEPNELFKPCLSDIESDLRNGDVRIVIVGSLFGGTGAAGIPTVLKMVQEYCQTRSGLNLSRLHFGGVLFTPYFKVPPKPGSAFSGNITIESDTFLSTTRAALFYYQFQDAFQKIYLVGKQEPDLISPEYKDGGEEQDNRSHAVELLSSIAVKDFLTDGAMSQDSMNRVAVLTLRPQENEEDLENRLSWNSDCMDRDFWALANMLRTQTLLEADIYPYAEKKQLHPHSLGMYQWYKIYGMKRYDFENEEDDLTNMRRYTEDFLNWMYDLQYRYKDVGRDEREQDPEVAFCGDVMEDLAELTKSEGEQNEDFPSLWNILEKFDSVVDQNIGYVNDRAFEILSLLGIPNPADKFYLAGLFQRLLDMASETKEPK